MRLDRNICLGGRLNGKEILGIKYGSYIIYPIEKEDVDEDYVVVCVSEEPIDIIDIFHHYIVSGVSSLDTINPDDYIMEESTYSIGLIITKVKPINKNVPAAYIQINRYSDIVKKVMKMSGYYLPEGIDPNQITSFYECKSLEYVDISELNISNATNLDWMFYGCKSLTTIKGFDNLDTGHITNMFIMFGQCEKLESIDLSNFDTSSVTTMENMFYRCRSLKRLDLSNFDTSNLISAAEMFYLCDELEEIDMRNFDMSKVNKNTTNIHTSNSNYQMLGHCNKLHTLRLDNCSNDTIDKIINSVDFPTGTIDGETRKIYCKREEAAGLTEPDGWEFIYMDTLVSYDESQEKLLAPDYTIAEVVDEQLIINQGFAIYDADNENININ